MKTNIKRGKKHEEKKSLQLEFHEFELYNKNLVQHDVYFVQQKTKQHDVNQEA
jgi:hypothetical protein